MRGSGNFSRAGGGMARETFVSQGVGVRGLLSEILPYESNKFEFTEGF